MSGTRHTGPNEPFELVVAVGSQGALSAFKAIVSSLPVSFPAAVVFGLHRNDPNGLTERILRHVTALPVRTAVDGLTLEPGTVYVAPFDRQLELIENRRMRVIDGHDQGGRYRFADTLLSSATEVFGPRMIAVVLSGRLDGGAEGVRAAKRRGARVLVQDPATAEAPSMPNAALASGCADFALPPESLGSALVALCAAAGAAELFRVRLNVGVRS